MAGKLNAHGDMGYIITVVLFCSGRCMTRASLPGPQQT